MSRKRIIAALLLIVTFALGAACYLQLTRTAASKVAVATPVAPHAPASVEQLPGEIGSADESLAAAETPETGSVRALPEVPRAAVANPADADAAGTSDETQTVSFQSVSMPANPIVLASASDSGGSQSGRSFAGRSSGLARGGGGGGGGSGSAGGGSQDQSPQSNTPDPGSPGSADPEDTGPAGNTEQGTTPDETSLESPPSGPVQTPDDSQDPGDSTPKTEEPPQNNDEGEGAGKGPGDEEGEQPPLVNEPPGDPPYYEPDDPGHEDKPVNVPEPSTLALLAAGLAALGVGRRRRKTK